MAKLKGIIFSVEDVVLSKNGFDKGVFEELTRFISFLKFKNIEFAVLTNRAWIVGDKPLEDAIKSKWGEFPYFCRAKDKSIPPKPKTDATKYVIDKMDWKQEERSLLGPLITICERRVMDNYCLFERLGGLIKLIMVLNLTR